MNALNKTGVSDGSTKAFSLNEDGSASSLFEKIPGIRIACLGSVKGLNPLTFSPIMQNTVFFVPPSGTVIRGRYWVSSTKPTNLNAGGTVLLSFVGTLSVFFTEKMRRLIAHGDGAFYLFAEVEKG